MQSTAIIYAHRREIEVEYLPHGPTLTCTQKCAQEDDTTAHAQCQQCWWVPNRMSLVMADSSAVVDTEQSCSTTGCSKPASLQCPTCLKLGIQGSFFCSQVRTRAQRTRQFMQFLSVSSLTPSLVSQSPVELANETRRICFKISIFVRAGVF